MLKDFSNIFLISDLDGTLLTGEKRISESDRASIAEFIEQGGHFAIATGRVRISAMPYIEQVHANMPCILFNGGMIIDPKTGSVLWKKGLPPEAKDYVSEILDAFPEAGAELLTAEQAYALRVDSILQYKIDFEKMHHIFIEPQEIREPWMKVLFTAEPEVIERISEFVRERGYSGIFFVKSSDVYYEMLPEGVSKGAALHQMQRMDLFRGMKTAAVGDYMNDIEMIRYADVGACVADSPGEVKEQADVVLTRTSNQDALTELINHIKNIWR